MPAVAIIVSLAAIAAAFVASEIGAGFAYFVALTSYLAITLAVVLELLPGLRRGVEFIFRSLAERRRRIRDRRAFERQLYRALWR